ncbi:hypothetical protein LIA77_10489 [Sarocladium implicatum]|nr:hypothetical protein LIA77_10489 [Sarocladium implicatum]
MADELAGQWKMGMRPRQASTNLQAFGGQLGGQGAPAITNSGDPERPFEVDGDTFPDYNSAFDRACDNQKNACADQANNGGGDFEVGDCDNQNNECKAAGASATQTSFAVLLSAKTSSSRPKTSLPPAADAQDGPRDHRSPSPTPSSPAFSTASTADGQEDIGSSPAFPALPAPALPERVRGLLRTPPPSAGGDENRYGTASWGSPYPRTDRNLRRLSFSSEASDDSPIHHLEIDTPFLRSAPEAEDSHIEPQPSSSLTGAAAVLANRVRRQTTGLTEDWIRTHTAGDLNESKHWFSEGSESEHSSLSGSESGWHDGSNTQTPRAGHQLKSASRRQTRYPRGGSSIDTLKPGESFSLRATSQSNMASPEKEVILTDAASEQSQITPSEELPPPPQSPMMIPNGAAKAPSTPPRGSHKPLPKEPAMTPRLKKKVPWRGKNIQILLPRDDERGRPGQAPMPLRQDQIEGIFADYKELGYNVDGFDLLVEGYQPPGTDDSQSRDNWPNMNDMVRERAERSYKVTLPDLNAWKDYVNELQEAKLRALGVFTAEDDPEPEPEPEQLVSPPLSGPSRGVSAQYPPLPFSPPIPTSSAASNGGMPGYPFPQHFMQASSAAQTNPDWGNQSGFMPGMNRGDSPSLMNINGLMSPQSPFGIEGLQQAGSPGLNMHQRHQSLQYPMLQHQFQQPAARASPRLQEVREDEEDHADSKSPSKTPEPSQRNPDSLQAEIDEAEYHLEEQLRTQLEHADYNPKAQGEKPGEGQIAAAKHARDVSADNFPEPEHFANKPSEPLVLHHPRPHSRGHSLTQNLFKESHEAQATGDNDKPFSLLNDIPETQKGDEADEIDTNPSNLGTPVQSFDFAPVMGQHQKTISATSNPWNGGGSSNAGSRRPSHGSKPSLSKLNVKAPEFKFNLASTFTPGQQFTFGGNTFQPAIYQAGTEPQAEIPPVANNVVQFGSTPKFSGDAPSFSPGQSDFSFSTSGPKFRPDAPAFTPFQSLSGSVTSPTASGSESVGNRSSIFGNIDIKTSDIVKPIKKSKAIPIVRPSSRTSAKSIRINTDDDDDDDDMKDDADGRVTVDESRVKRARSSAPDGDEVPAFAEQPAFEQPAFQETSKTEDNDLEEGELEEDAEGEIEPTLPVDTSLSSITSDQHADTKETTAAPSETSPADDTVNRWPPFEFGNKFEASNFDQSRVFGEDDFKHAHKKTLSATAPAFTPTGSIFSPNAAAFVPSQAPFKAEQPEETKVEDTQESLIEVSPISPQDVASTERSRDVSPPHVEPKPRVVSKGLGASRFASPPPKPKGLAASRYASEASPPSREPELPSTPPADDSVDFDQFLQEPEPESQADRMLPSVEYDVDEASVHSPTFEEIDDIMLHLGTDPSRGVNKMQEIPPRWEQPVPATEPSITAIASSQPYKLDPPEAAPTARETASPTPRPEHTFQNMASQPSAVLEDPFVDPPISPPALEAGELVEHPASRAVSDWEQDFSEDEKEKVQSRAQFFDGRVNEIVGNLLTARLEPLEKALLDISDGLALRSHRGSSTRRDMRSLSGELQHSDADDEDEEPVLRRSMSPRRDRRMEHIRAAVMEAFAAQQRTTPAAAAAAIAEDPVVESAVLKALAEMKDHLGENLRLDFRGEDLKNIVEDAVERRMPESPKPNLEMTTKVDELSAKLIDLEERLQLEREKVEKEVTERRAAEDVSAELNRKLQAAETRVEVEIINRSVFDQRVTDLEERLRNQESKTEQELENRRNAEDRLSEVQRLLRIATEEESRLREVVEEKDIKIKTLEHASGETSAHMALLDASQANSMQAQSEMTNKLNSLEADLRVVRQDNHHWRSEAERADENARRNSSELAQALDENKHIQKSLDTLTTQLEENERLRETWRVKFMSLQEDMGNAAREIAEENASRIKKEQAMLARQEVLDARLQAEAKTRERLEVEMERLQMNERSGMRAVNECKRLEGIIGELKTENHKLAQTAAQHHRDYEEARESGMSEVKRARMALQVELDTANHQVNVVREDLEEQNNKLRAELDSFKLEADTAKARNEMLLEDAQTNKATEIEELKEKHQNELENLQARLEHQLGTAIDEGQKTENHLLERLSFSASKMEHLQDRIVHLEEKLEVAKEAAAAAAQAAKSAGVDAGSAAALNAKPRASSQKLDVPEKISPQALRESIMVLQEQLQAREQRIEELESNIAKLDPEAPTKISKRDDEISWLRELLAVRHGDLQDIIAALSSEHYNKERVKDAAIRLKANLQMEEQERERALNGGSALNLPSLVQSATPRVAQAVGPLAAAWGSWRKSSSGSFSSLSAALNSPAPARNSTPSRSTQGPRSGSQSGLMTPPASGLRQSPLVDSQPQPTAFASTGRRFPSQSSRARIDSGGSRSNVESTSSRARVDSYSSRRAEKMPAHDTTPPRAQQEDDFDESGPVTPPMMRQSGYDSDAQPGDFDDHDFFED